MKRPDDRKRPTVPEEPEMAVLSRLDRLDRAAEELRQIREWVWADLNSKQTGDDDGRV